MSLEEEASQKKAGEAGGQTIVPFGRALMPEPKIVRSTQQ
jgi:hypothetical protein